MRKKVSMVLLVLILLVAMTGCATQKKKDYIAEVTGIVLPDGGTLEYKEEMEGIVGDGVTYATLTYNPKDAELVTGSILNNEHWSTLPLTENINLIMYGGMKDSIDYAYEYALIAGIPDIENGYWFILDRSAEDTTTYYNDEKLLDRVSFNFSYAVFDFDTNILYFFEIDT